MEVTNGKIMQCREMNNTDNRGTENTSTAQYLNER